MRTIKIMNYSNYGLCPVCGRCLANGYCPSCRNQYQENKNEQDRTNERDSKNKS